MALLTLENSIKDHGINQRDLVDFLKNVVTNVNELSTDHATSKVTIDALVTLTTELRVDHAVAKTFQDEIIVDHAVTKTFQDEIIADHATNIAVIADNKAAINAIIAAATTDGATAIAGVSVVSTSPAATLTATAISTLTATAVSTITATAPTAGPATLTNTPLTLLGG